MNTIRRPHFQMPEAIVKKGDEAVLALTLAASIAGIAVAYLVSRNDNEQSVSDEPAAPMVERTVSYEYDTPAGDHTTIVTETQLAPFTK